MNHEIGNIVEGVKSGLILQQVNCQGVMGSGVAAAIRRRWPVVYDEYVQFVGRASNEFGQGAHLLGNMQVVSVEPGLSVVNLFSQQYYGRTGERFTSYDALDTSLAELRKFMDSRDIPQEDVHHPLIGSGLGGGNWPIISGIIQHRLGYHTTLWTLE